MLALEGLGVNIERALFLILVVLVIGGVGRREIVASIGCLVAIFTCNNSHRYAIFGLTFPLDKGDARRILSPIRPDRHLHGSGRLCSDWDALSVLDAFAGQHQTADAESYKTEHLRVRI